MNVQIEFYQIRKIYRNRNLFLAFLFGSPLPVRVSPRFRSFALQYYFLGIDGKSRVRCVLDAFGFVLSVDSSCNLVYKKKLITPLTDRIIF